MGLNISHDAWHGAYSAFDRWRNKIAEVAGIPLPLMEGHYGSFLPLDVIASNYIGNTPGNDTGRTRAMEYHALLPLRWEALKPDPLHVLLHHSDCDGKIGVKHLKKLANRLEELLPLLPDEDGGGHIGNWREKTQKFIDGTRLAYSLKQPLLFQ
jgi:hypothetical protein